MWTAIGLVLSRSGATVEKVWRGNPAIKWAVLILVGLLALDLAARESIALWKEAATAGSTIDATNEKNKTEAISAKIARGQSDSPPDKPLSVLKQFGPVETSPQSPVDISQKAMQKTLLDPNK